ncbi:LysM peptidoglycan-binding domain-containing protein [Candidatus Saccharibacteria bacterium]|nr:LysM peptidoglycan-binding domain-containing protein [Candidatus Saccharibacteria bacterium]
MKTKKTQKTDHHPFLRAVGYVLSAAAVFGLVYYGSQNKTAEENGVPIMMAISDSNYSVSVDQLSELYIVAEIANNVSLSSSSYLNMDYISAVTQYSINQTASSRIEKTNIVDTSSLAKGVIEYEVGAGESMENIAASFGLTTDQIRWSNGLKTTDISAGQTLYLPSVSGIVYTIKEGDSADSIASKYGSSATEITEKNNLAARGVTAGTKIVVPNGVVPETERPEYVPPAPVVVRPTYSYAPAAALSYSGSNPMPYGWCTWYAWQWRYDNGMPLPTGLGNARYWDNQLYGSYRIDRNPEYGAVFVAEGGYYGHVGIVIGVNDDGTITVSDMNGPQGWGRIATHTYGPSEWGNYSFIHERL